MLSKNNDVWKLQSDCSQMSKYIVKFVNSVKSKLWPYQSAGGGRSNWIEHGIIIGFGDLVVVKASTWIVTGGYLECPGSEGASRPMETKRQKISVT